MEGYARGRRRSSRERERKNSGRTQQAGLNNQGFFQGEQTEPEQDSRVFSLSGNGGRENPTYNQSGDRTDSPFSSTLPNRPYNQSQSALSLDASADQHPPFREDPEGAPDSLLDEEHRPGSTSLDESFAGPSLALYDFTPENNNELALREGQIIQVGYRHGQGWLVAQDMETGEQGLVPEEYVRLLRDIEGWGEEDEAEAEAEAEGEELAETTDPDPSTEPSEKEATRAAYDRES